MAGAGAPVGRGVTFAGRDVFAPAAADVAKAYVAAVEGRENGEVFEATKFA